ncbi:MAG TPA: hypothetical protein VLG11_05640 [Candidatus Saccharimonadales bacterium]|nr:hypothetical protein [Candidatus Saccharimonadales bacterium]
MRQVEVNGQNLGLEHLHFTLDPPTAELRAQQMSNLMAEVYSDVFERELGLLPTRERPFYFEDASELVGLVDQSGRPGKDGRDIETVVAIDLAENGQPSRERLAVRGLLVARKLQGLCTADVHTSAEIYEIDITREMYGTKLAYYLLDSLVGIHPADPHITARIHSANKRSIRFHQKLGLKIDETAAPVTGGVYPGEWLTMTTTGQAFSTHLTNLLH